MNTLKSEHLNPQEKPIQVCFDYLRNGIKEEILYLLGFNKVYYYCSSFRNKIRGNIIHKDGSFYVISPINGKNKISKGYYNCTGLVIIGKNKKGKNISFLTHQDPCFLFEGWNNYDKLVSFKNDLQSKIDEFKEKSITGTIDICIVGGNYVDGDDDEYKKNYIKSIELLREIVFENFGFYPCVTGPILDSGFTDIVVDTKNRRIFQRRRRKEDFTLLDNTLFQADKPEEIIGELDEKCKLKKRPLREIFT